MSIKVDVIKVKCQFVDFHPSIMDIRILIRGHFGKKSRYMTLMMFQAFLINDQSNISWEIKKTWIITCGTEIDGFLADIAQLTRFTINRWWFSGSSLYFIAWIPHAWALFPRHSAAPCWHENCHGPVLLSRVCCGIINALCTLIILRKRTTAEFSSIQTLKTVAKTVVFAYFQGQSSISAQVIHYHIHSLLFRYLTHCIKTTWEGFRKNTIDTYITVALP